jgi:hypothetical protein
MADIERPGDVAGPPAEPDPVLRNRDVNIRGVVWSGVGLVVVGVVITVAVWVQFRVLRRETNEDQPRLSPMVEANLRRTPPEPRLEANPLAPRLRIRAEEDEVLRSYAWVDKGSGLVRIPIDRAMQLIAERGLPPSKPMPASAAGTSSSAVAPPNPNPFPQQPPGGGAPTLPSPPAGGRGGLGEAPPPSRGGQ